MVPPKERESAWNDDYKKMRIRMVKFASIKTFKKVDFEESKEIRNSKIVIDHFGYWPTFHD